jgi:crotonobetainyl-CoA:carnitine CoA-transferase CaiB-like acyl-CoA transferase
MSLLDAQVAGLTNLGLGYLATGRVPPRAGNRLATIYPSDSFRCADGDLMIIVGNDAQFCAFCAALGMPEVSTDACFARNADRLRHADALALLIGQALRDRTLAECQALFDAAGVPASPINTLAQVFADPQVIARGLVQKVVRPDGQAVRVIANPIRMSRTPPCSDRPPPRLGEHTGAVVAALPSAGSDRRWHVTRV